MNQAFKTDAEDDALRAEAKRKGELRRVGGELSDALRELRHTDPAAFRSTCRDIQTRRVAGIKSRNTL